MTCYVCEESNAKLYCGMRSTAGTPPVYQTIDGMMFTDWSCYRSVSLRFLFTGGREDSVNCYVCGWSTAKLYCGIRSLTGASPVYEIIDGMTFTDWSCYRYVSP